MLKVGVQSAGWYSKNDPMGSFRYIKECGFDYFCTTLTVSRHKDAVRINTLAEEIAAEVGIAWLPSDFKKKNGYKRSCELSEIYSLYRQDYCGCEFSKKAAERRKRSGGKDCRG